MAFGRDPRNHPDTPGFNAWLERRSAQYWAEDFPKTATTFFTLVLIAGITLFSLDMYSGGKISGIK